MARLIQQKIKEPLAEELLFGQLQHGGQAVIEVVDDDIRLAIFPAGRASNEEPGVRGEERPHTIDKL